MAITVPSGCYRQPIEQEGIDASGAKTFNYVLKGPYSSLKTCMHGLTGGQEIESGWGFVSATLNRNPGGLGTLTITCKPIANGESSGGSDASTTPLDEIWQIKSCRNDMSVLAYCGKGASNPCREWIEAWMKEPDGELANANSFRKPDGEVFVIDVASEDSNIQSRALPTVAVMGKLREGKESVMRFYPLLICTKIYSVAPASVYENLSYIDTPSPGTTTNKPGNLSTIISNHEWLKCQDDCEQMQNGNWRRIQAWIGAPAWDENFYGLTNRWPMPYSHTSS